eukprot:Skav200999  [mRNA]  locus=scaffold991:172808:173936:+ [translate_table: standard]
MTYLRIGLGLKELGPLTAILELWPKGYLSPKHHHGGCAGSVRVLHGEIHCKLYETLRDKKPMKFKDGDCGLKLPPGEHDTLILKAGDTTWLNRQNWWVHEVWCGAGDFALSLHLYKSCTDEFAFVKPADEKSTAEIAKGAPKNDFFWNLAEGLGLSKGDWRIKDIDQPGGPTDFVRCGVGRDGLAKASPAKRKLADLEPDESNAVLIHAREHWFGKQLSELLPLLREVTQGWSGERAELTQRWSDERAELLRELTRERAEIKRLRQYEDQAEAELKRHRKFEEWAPAEIGRLRKEYAVLDGMRDQMKSLHDEYHASMIERLRGEEYEYEVLEAMRAQMKRLHDEYHAEMDLYLMD